MVEPSKRWDALTKPEVGALAARLQGLALPFEGKDSNKEEFGLPPYAYSNLIDFTMLLH